MRQQITAEQAEIKGLLKAQLPQYPAGFYDGCFQQPTYHWGLLHDLAKVFEFGEIPQVAWASLHLKDSDLQDTKLVEMVWLAEFLNVPNDPIMTLIMNYRDSLNIQHQPQFIRNPVPNHNNNTRSNIRNVEHVQTPNGPQYNFTTHSNVGMPGNRPHAQEMDSRTLSPVIQTISSNKFSGALDESIDLLFTMFNLACQKFRVLENEKMDLLTYAFNGAARNHYISNMNRCNNYFEAEAMMRQSYNSAARQLQVVRLLDQLRYRKFTSEKNITNPSEGLKALVEYVELLMPLTPVAYHHQSHKVSFLKKAVIDQPWAKEPVKNINSLSYDFHTFVTALHDSIQADIEMQSAKLEGEAEALVNYVRNKTNSTATHITTADQPNQSDLFETLLGHFGRHPRDLKRNQYNRHNANNYISNPCRRCGAQWRPGHRCEQNQLKSHIRNRIKKGDNHVHIISDLVNTEADSTGASENGDDDNGEHSTHLATFDRLVENESDDMENVTESHFMTNQISAILTSANPQTDEDEKDFWKGVHS